jgi:hypothetical protein
MNTLVHKYSYFPKKYHSYIQLKIGTNQSLSEIYQFLGFSWIHLIMGHGKIYQLLKNVKCFKVCQF